MADTQIEFLEEFAAHYPEPEEPWQEEEQWDPRWSRTAISAAYRAGRVDVDKTNPANWRFRFTQKGRDFLRARKKNAED